MMTKLLFLIINDLSKSNKKDQISSPFLYHAEKATEVFQSNNITRTRTWRKKLFESFKAKEESSPPHTIHFEALTHTTYKNNNNCTSSSKHTQRKIARKKEQRPKSRGDRNKKERKRKKTDQHSDTTVPWHTNSEHTTTKRDHEAQTAK